MIFDISRFFNLVYLGAFPIKNEDYFERSKFEWWLANGYNADMEYLNKVNLNLADLFPWGRSVLIFAWLYPPIRRKHKPGYGFIANYAVWRDYHKVFKKNLIKFASFLQSKLNLGRFQALTDAFPVLEKRIASELDPTNLFMGKNTLVIHKYYGTYFLLGEVVTDIKVNENMPSVNSGTSRKNKLGCGACSSCEDKCPTKALEMGVLDSRKCISYLTIENKKPFSLDQIRMVGDWLFGCDICQDVCPFNHKLKFKNYSSFSSVDRRLPNAIPIDFLLNLTKTEFFEVFKGSPIMRAGYAGMIRNAIAVATNQNLVPIIDLFDKIKKRFEDSDLSENEISMVTCTIQNAFKLLDQKKNSLVDSSDGKFFLMEESMA